MVAINCINFNRSAFGSMVSLALSTPHDPKAGLRLKSLNMNWRYMYSTQPLS